jgi:biotin-dependent carboxylase-like uncharacterized protein
MNRLRVVEPGLMTTPQDLGRPGYAAMGVPPSGAADTLSLRIGNRLLGNPDHAAALECTILGPSVTLDRDTFICLTGAPCPDARVAGTSGPRQIAWAEPTRVAPGELIKLGRTEGGARAYLCIAGGLDGPKVLGSRSTLPNASLGGSEGRALREGDTIPVGSGGLPPEAHPGCLPEFIHKTHRRAAIRVIPSLHTERFPRGAFEQLCSGAFTVSERSNRIGVRLEGPALPLPDKAGSFESEPTVTGGIQIPGDAQPIILGVDRPTTGGYPLLACVIRADLPALAMLRPRDTVRFERCTIDDARRIEAEQRRRLDELLPPSQPIHPSRAHR